MASYSLNQLLLNIDVLEEKLDPKILIKAIALVYNEIFIRNSDIDPQMVELLRNSFDHIFD